MRIIVLTYLIKCSFKVIHKTCLFKCHAHKYQDIDLCGIKNNVFKVTYHQLAESDIV